MNGFGRGCPVFVLSRQNHRKLAHGFLHLHRHIALAMHMYSTSREGNEVNMDSAGAAQDAVVRGWVRCRLHAAMRQCAMIRLPTSSGVTT